MAAWKALCLVGIVVVSLGDLAHAHNGVDHDAEPAAPLSNTLCAYDSAASGCRLNAPAIQSHLGLAMASACTTVGGSLNHMDRRRLLQTNTTATTNDTIPLEVGGGWECDAQRTAMGCKDQKILHVMAGAGMTHYMMVCMVNTTTDPDAAQAWWDAYSAALDCSQHVPAADCSTQIVSQLQAASGDKNANDVTALQTFIVSADSACRAATSNATCMDAAEMVESMTPPTLVASSSTNTDTTNGTVSAAAVVLSTAAAVLATFATLLL